MFSDIFIITGFGFIDPILAIFVKENLAGGTIFAAGLASMLFFITKCFVQLPFSRYVDTHDDKVRWLLIGSAINITVPILYIFASNIYQVYLIQVVLGVGSGLIYPTWLGLWSTNLDKHHESFEWSLYSTVTGIGTAVSAAIGAAVAEFFGFNYTFAIVCAMAIVGFIILLRLERKKEKPERIPIEHYHARRKILKKQ
jgi:MFS family permease